LYVSESIHRFDTFKVSWSCKKKSTKCELEK